MLVDDARVYRYGNEGAREDSCFEKSGGREPLAVSNAEFNRFGQTSRLNKLYLSPN
jgi:hypothetical protein